MGGRLPVQCTASPLVPGMPPLTHPTPGCFVPAKEAVGPSACRTAVDAPGRARKSSFSINRLRTASGWTWRARQNRFGAHEPIRPLTRL